MSIQWHTLFGPLLKAQLTPYFRWRANSNPANGPARPICSSFAFQIQWQAVADTDIVTGLTPEQIAALKQILQMEPPAAQR
jgi:hypothetical protein